MAHKSGNIVMSIGSTSLHQLDLDRLGVENQVKHAKNAGIPVLGNRVGFKLR